MSRRLVPTGILIAILKRRGHRDGKPLQRSKDCFGCRFRCRVLNDDLCGYHRDFRLLGPDSIITRHCRAGVSVVGPPEQSISYLNDVVDEINRREVA